MKRIVFLNSFLIILIILSSTYNGTAQGIIPTKGKDFWIGFPMHGQFSNAIGTRRCDVFITCPINTSGTITFPAQGWSQSFTVTANQTTTVQVPVNIAENATWEVIENKGIQVLTADTVSVFAITFQKYTADATIIYPKQSLGTKYRVTSYQGLSSGAGDPLLNSDFLIVATEDDTQIKITTTVNTLGGHLAGVPFIIDLNKGQSYQVVASSYSLDLTGSVIEATDSSGSCRPFAVFSGSACVRVPTTCTACDIIYEQSLPVANWGKIYHSVPFNFATSYTLRILADQNNTSYTVNGGAPVNLNAGQFTEINFINGSRCIVANKPISITQFMEGVTCVGAGDPSMMYLNSQDQKIDEVTFSTITSTVITQHAVNVIMNTANISQLTLDGNPVPASSFTTLTSCTDMSYAQLSLTQGSHTLSATDGFSAYAYGTGNAESYAYSVGSFSKSQPIQVDSILCSTDTVFLGGQNNLFGIWWSTMTNPDDTIGTDPVLTLIPPIAPDIYLQHGQKYISGCDQTYYFNVEVPTPPQTWANSSSVPVCQNQQVQLSAGTIPQASVYAYSWTPAIGLSNPNISNPILTASVSGWYVVAISSPTGCMATVYDSTYVTVLLLPLPTANAGSNQTICKGASTTLTAAGGVSYLWSPGSVATDTFTVSPLVSTNYIVFVTGANGCVNSDTVNVGLFPITPANAGNDQSICMGSNATLTATGGISYLWTPGNSTNSSITVSPTINTSYSVQVTDNNGCAATDSVMVSIIGAATFNAGPDTTICQGSSILLSVPAGATSYSWFPGFNNTNSITVSPSTTTSYIVTVSGVNGCQIKDTVVVTVLSLVANAGADQTICPGTSATLSASGGGTYLWNQGGITTDTITVSPTATTNYIVFVTAANGCVDSDTVKVSISAPVIADAGSNQSICIGASATLTATGGTGYLWTPGNSATQSITVSPTSIMTYHVQVTNNNGCIGEDSVTVSIFSPSVYDAGPDITICQGASTLLSVPAGATSYAWLPGGNASNSITVSPTTNTNYIVSVIDNNGCLSKDTVVVNLSSITATLGPDQAICNGDSTILTTAAGFNYAWSTGANTSNSITVSPVINASYSVVVTDSIGCVATDLVNVTVNQLPIANAGADVSICKGLSTTLISAPTGNSYNWNPPSVNSLSVMVSPTTTTNYVLTVTDNIGCINYDTVTVTLLPLPIANAGLDQAICNGMTASLNGDGGVSYLWVTGGNTNQNISVMPSITTSYILQVTDGNGCQNKDTVIVEVTPSPIADYLLTNIPCVSMPLSFTSTSIPSYGTITDYLWQFGDNATSIDMNPTHTYANTGNYVLQLTITNSIGCSTSISKPITIYPKPIINFSAQNVCLGKEIQLLDLSTIESGSNVQWNWNFGDGNTDSIQNPVHFYVEAGNYDLMLTVTSDFGCVASAIKDNEVNIYPLPNARFTYSPIPVSQLNPIANFIDQSTGGTIWEWSFGDNSATSILQNPTYTYSDTGSFLVNLKLTNSFGCTDTASLRLIVEPYATFYIPNSFTPNDDGLNDFFGPAGFGTLNFEMIIFDRWGGELFHTTSSSQLWDGKVPGSDEQCMQGVYVYRIVSTDFKNEKRIHIGKVTLVR